MAININETGYAPKYVNDFIASELARFGILSGAEQMQPIFPTSPTNIEEVFKNYIAPPGIDDPLLIQYERLLRFRPNAFYRHKREQLVYYLYSTNLTKVLDAHRIISECLDREDSSAEDLHKWATDSEAYGAGEMNVKFHNFKVYQADETRDVLELASARTVYANKLIIEYDYHTTGSLYA